jgi:hypothetical protein
VEIINAFHREYNRTADESLVSPSPAGQGGHMIPVEQPELIFQAIAGLVEQDR